MRVEIRLDGPPRGKGAGRAFAMMGGGARIFTDDRTRKYESQLRYAAQQVMAGRPPIGGACQVCIDVSIQVPISFSKKKRAEALAGEIYPTIKPDCNNYSKACDALNGVVWEDDKQIVTETVRKRYAEQPSLVIVVETLCGHLFEVRT